jgi:hypothetical protein
MSMIGPFRNKSHRVAFLFWIMVFGSGFAFLQTSGIQNGGFETGDLDGWAINGEVSVVEVDTDSTTGDYLQQVADGQYAAMIGDSAPWSGTGQQQSGLEQTVLIPSNTPSDAVLQFTYAVVANDPPNHPEADKPRFRVLVQDIDTQQVLSDTNYTYTSQTSGEWYLGERLTGSISQQPFSTLNQDRWVFKPWTEVQIPVNGLSGHNLRILFEVRDCNWGAHPIYGLLDQVRIGSPVSLTIPPLNGTPSPAVYINPPFWAGITQWLEQMGLIWLCCLLPLLFLLGLLLWLFLNNRSRRSSPRVASGWGGSSSKTRKPAKKSGGGASPW